MEHRLLQKLVAVVLPEGPTGPLRFVAAGATRVLVLGSCPVEPGLEVLPGPLTLASLPLREDSVDALTCLEGFGGLAVESRRSLIAEARRVLRRGGFLALCAPAADADLWRAKDDLRQHFPHVVVFAQLEWQGFSLVPLLEGQPGEAPVSVVREGLLRSPLPTRAYLLLASLDAFDEALTCTLVPTGPSQRVVQPETKEIAKEIPVTFSLGAPPDIEDLFAEGNSAPSVGAFVAPPKLDSNAEIERLHQESAGLERERDKFRTHAGKLAAELEHAREAKARTETELLAARLLIESLQRVSDDSRVHPLPALLPTGTSGVHSSVVTHVLVEEVAPLVAPEAGRATTDAALDRNRLREELARRTVELQALETQVLQQEEELRREHLENVRLVTDVDRMREQVERSRAIEQERVQELERLGHELRKLEVVHAELQGLHNAQEQRLREREAGTDKGGVVRSSLDASTEREQFKSRERAAGEVLRRRERELAEATRTIRELRRSLEDHASIAAELRGELAVMQVQVQRLAETVPILQERLREQQRKTLDHEEEAGVLQRRLEEGVSEQERLRGRLRLQRQELDVLTGAKQGAEIELFRLRRELEAKHQAIEQLQQIVALGTGRVDADAMASQTEGARADVLHLRTTMAEQAVEHAEALARSEAEHQRIVESERGRVRRFRLEAGIRAEEMEYLLFQLDTAEQRIWEMNDATDRAAARLAAGLAQLDKQKEQYEDLVDELEVTRNLLVQAQAKIAEMERLLDSERARLARVSLGPTPTSDPESFDVSVDESTAEGDEVAPQIQRSSDEPDRLAGINFDDDPGQEHVVALLAGEPSDSALVRSLGLEPSSASSTSSSVFGLPSDQDVELDDDELVLPPSRVVIVPDEDDDDVFSIDTEGWLEDDEEEERHGQAGQPSQDREHSNSRIVIEVLEDEAWPEDEVTTVGHPTGSAKAGPKGSRGS